MDGRPEMRSQRLVLRSRSACWDGVRLTGKEARRLANAESVPFAIRAEARPDPKRRGWFRAAISELVDAIRPLTNEPLAANPVRTTASVMVGYSDDKAKVN